MSDTTGGPHSNGHRPESAEGWPARADVESEPDPDASAEAIAAAARFFAAIASQDHNALWQEFSEDARAYVINLALERGMDFDFASRLRGGTAGQEEFDDYARDLLAGVRADVGDLDFERLTYEATVEPSEPDKLRVIYLVAFDETLGQGPSAIPAGSLVMSYDGTRWRVERLIPKPGE